MVHRRQASGAVDFVTDVVTRTFTLLVKVTLVILLVWAVPTFGPKILAFVQGPAEPERIDFAYSSATPTPQVSSPSAPSVTATDHQSVAATVSPRPSE